MKELAGMLATMAAGLLLVAVAVFTADDRKTLVPVPEAATESFAREIATRRFDLALRYLATEVERRETLQTIEARFAPLFAEAGTVNHVSAEPEWMEGDLASAKAIWEGDAGTVSLTFGLVREEGLWKIRELPDAYRSSAPSDKVSRR